MCASVAGCRSLRSRYPGGFDGTSNSAGAEETPAAKPAAKPKKQPWPKSLSAQAAAVQSALATIAAPADETDIARHFTRAKKERIAELLEKLTSLGKARELADGRYLPV